MNWRPIINSNKSKEVHEIIMQIVSSVEGAPIKREIGLMNGICGEMLFFSYLNKYTNTNRYSNQIAKRYEIIIEDISTFNRLPGTMCFGTIGIIWTLNHLIKNNFIKADISFGTFFNYFSEYISIYSKEGDFDFLHGSSGTVLGLLDVYKRNSNVSIPLQYFFKELENNSIQTEQTAKWVTTIMVDRNNEDVCNLSFAHGITSTIVILCELLKNSPDNKKIKTLLIKSINFLLESKLNDKNSTSIFPPWVLKSKPQNNGGSRLGWCYGDLGCAITLYKAGKILRNQRYITEAIDILLHSVKRKRREDTQILDASFCHGTAGVAHIYNRFYQKTRLQDFKDASLYWYEQTLQFANKNSDEVFMYFNRVADKCQRDHSLLSGSLGIGLSLMTANSNVSPKWDRCFLLS